MSKAREYLEGLILLSLLYLVFTTILGVVTVFVIAPIFIFLKTGEFVLVPTMDYAITVIKMIVAGSLTGSVIVFNINWFSGKNYTDL